LIHFISRRLQKGAGRLQKDAEGWQTYHLTFQSALAAATSASDPEFQTMQKMLLSGQCALSQSSFPICFTETPAANSVSAKPCIVLKDLSKKVDCAAFVVAQIPPSLNSISHSQALN
jgi:hypothetical protein